MRNRFDYKESINNIKANLFDIYEDQERLIGLEESEEQKGIMINTFIELKNTSAIFIDKLESLYGDAYFKDTEDNITYDENNDVDNDNNNSSSPEIIEEHPIEEESIQEENIEHNNNENQQLPKYYLNCDFDKVNFAYVPMSIYEKIKNYKNEDDTDEFNEEEQEENIEQEPVEEKIVDNHFYKQDLEKVKGIIVRSDQYMKLALSRHRQAGVLEEAKEYRKEEVLKKQRENQKRELEKAELKFDI